MCKWYGAVGWFALALGVLARAAEPGPPSLALDPTVREATADEAAESTELAAPSAVADALPAPLTHYRGREIAPTMSHLGAAWLTRDTREAEERAEEMLAALGLAAGQNVCDFGCGNGYHTLKMAEHVGPSGRVWAVDLQSEMLHLLDERAKAAGMANIVPVESTEINPKLPPASQDLVLLVDVYHELSYPEQVLAALRASLRPRGRLVLVEFREEDPLVPIKPLHKMSKAQILREILPNGFRLAEQYDKLPWQHLMAFVRDDAPADAEALPAGAEAIRTP